MDIPLEHIHPMLVHFPIVLFFGALALDFLTAVTGRDLTQRTALPALALIVLWLGVAAAVVTAFLRRCGARYRGSARLPAKRAGGA
jgi:uncharacterized membrane protein